MRPVLLAAVVAAVVTACGGTDPTQPLSPGGGDPGGETVAGPHGGWVLVEAEPAIAVPGAARITLVVEDDAGQLRVGGTAACNSYGGTVVADADGAWSLADVARTEMGCEPVALMEAESAYLDALMAIDTWERPDDDTLQLTGPGVALRFELLPEVEPAALTGTTWELDGFVHGTGADGAVSSTVAGVEPAVLRFEDDGTFTLFTGCRDFAGEWTTNGDEILLPSWGETEDSRGVGADGELTCGDQAEAQEGDVIAVVESGFRLTVDGQRLTLQKGDEGLTFRASE